jgi:hypothetical protein
MASKNGTINIYLNEALQIQLPPDNSIDWFSTNVKAKKKAAKMPNSIGPIPSPLCKC